MQGLYTGDQVRDHFRHAFSVRGFKLSSKSFPDNGWIAHALKNPPLFSAKASGFLEFRLKRPRPAGHNKKHQQLGIGG